MISDLLDNKIEIISTKELHKNCISIRTQISFMESLKNTSSMIAQCVKWLKNMNPVIFFCVLPDIHHTINRLNGVNNPCARLKYSALKKILANESDVKKRQLKQMFANLINESDSEFESVIADQMVYFFERDVQENKIDFMAMCGIKIRNGVSLARGLRNVTTGYHNTSSEQLIILEDIFAEFETTYIDPITCGLNYDRIFKNGPLFFENLSCVVVEELTKHFQCRTITANETNKMKHYAMHTKEIVLRKYHCTSDGAFEDLFLSFFYFEDVTYKQILGTRTTRLTQQLLRHIRLEEQNDVRKQISSISLLNKTYNKMFKKLVTVVTVQDMIDRTKSWTCNNEHKLSNSVVAQIFLETLEATKTPHLHDEINHVCQGTPVGMKILNKCPQCVGHSIKSGYGSIAKDSYFKCVKCDAITYLMFDYNGNSAKCVRCR